MSAPVLDLSLSPANASDSRRPDDRESEARALAKARDGGRLEDLCDPFVGQSEPAQAAFRTLLSWFADGWVSAVSAGD